MISYLLAPEYIDDELVHGFSAACIMRLTTGHKTVNLVHALVAAKVHQDSGFIFLGHCLVHRHGIHSGLVVGQSDMYYSTIC
jgi:hypothetical protein